MAGPLVAGLSASVSVIFSAERRRLFPQHVEGGVSGDRQGDEPGNGRRGDEFLLHDLAPELLCSLCETKPANRSLGDGRNIFLIIGAHGGREGARLRILTGCRCCDVAQPLEFVVVDHGHTSPAERINVFSRFFASWMCQETVVSEIAIVSAAAAWLKPSP